jgi:glycosyltransferase involved in cell wall biosynthesis
VCPTRNRPEFIKTSLRFFSEQDSSAVRLLIVDNSSPSEYATKEVVEQFNHPRVDYVRTTGELSMVDNWEFSLDNADGEYIGFLTDKMFLRPKFVETLVHYLSSNDPEIISWHDDRYMPKTQGAYFKEGTHVIRITKQNSEFVDFIPSEVLESRYFASVTRASQSPKDYAIGKICFGLYSADLIAKIRAKHKRLFFPISPDYTSMVLALGTARAGVFARTSGVIHVDTDLSNGGLVATSDLAALDFLRSVDPTLKILHDLPVPHLYCSTNNLILNDYRQMLNKLEIPYSVSLGNWAEYISTDINSNSRTWSSSSVYTHQRGLLDRAISQEKLKVYIDTDREKNFSTSIFLAVQSKCPNALKKTYRWLRFGRAQRACKEIFEILTF